MDKPKNLMPLMTLIALEHLAQEEPSTIDKYLETLSPAEVEEFERMLEESSAYHKSVWRCV